MKIINTILLSTLVALGSATVQADTSTGPLLLNNAQLDTVDAGRRYSHRRNWTRASASAGGEVRIVGAVYANGGADSSSSGNGTSTAGATGGAMAIGARFGGYYGASGGAAVAGGSSYSCSGRC